MQLARDKIIINNIQRSAGGDFNIEQNNELLTQNNNINYECNDWRIWPKIFKSNSHCQIKVYPSRVYKHSRVIVETNKNHEALCQFFDP